MLSWIKYCKHKHLLPWGESRAPEFPKLVQTSTIIYKIRFSRARVCIYKIVDDLKWWIKFIIIEKWGKKFVVHILIFFYFLNLKILKILQKFAESQIMNHLMLIIEGKVMKIAHSKTMQWNFIHSIIHSFNLNTHKL